MTANENTQSNGVSFSLFSFLKRNSYHFLYYFTMPGFFKSLHLLNFYLSRFQPISKHYVNFRFEYYYKDTYLEDLVGVQEVISDPTHKSYYNQIHNEH